MPSLKDIRKRLHSVDNIKQITRAMEMVAGARLKRAQAKAARSRPYKEKMEQMIHHLDSGDIKHPLFEARSGTKIALVIVGADRGLCGSFNANLFTAVDQFLKSHADAQLFVYGKRAIDYYKRRAFKIRETRPNWGGVITFDEIKQETEKLIGVFLRGEADAIWIAYPRSRNSLVREVKIEKFLNFEKPEEAGPRDYLFEPNAAEIFAELLPRYAFVVMQNVLNLAYEAELSARVMAMREATKNADEMIEELTLTRNKVRQAGITKEMLEITSGGLR